MTNDQARMTKEIQNPNDEAFALARIIHEPAAMIPNKRKSQAGACIPLQRPVRAAGH